MKQLFRLFFFLIIGITVNAQQTKTISLDAVDFNNYKCRYAGAEVFGNAFLFSAFYEQSLITTSHFSLNIRPQFGFIPGSDEDSVQRHLVPILGLNAAFGKPYFYFAAGVSTGLDYSYGYNSYKTPHRKAYLYPVLSCGPRIVINENFLIGLSYHYFLKHNVLNTQVEHWFGISLGISF